MFQRNQYGLRKIRWHVKFKQRTEDIGTPILFLFPILYIVENVRRCRKMLLELKKKQAEYDQLMDKLQKEVDR